MLKHRHSIMQGSLVFYNSRNQICHSMILVQLKRNIIEHRQIPESHMPDCIPKKAIHVSFQISNVQNTNQFMFLLFTNQSQQFLDQQ